MRTDEALLREGKSILINVSYKYWVCCVLTCINQRRLTLESKMRLGATNIQRIVRGFLQRTHAQRQQRLKMSSSTLIQARYRGYTQKKKYDGIREKSIQIQSIFRAHSARQLYLRGKSATVSSQALIRKVLQRKKFIRQRTMAIRLQVQNLCKAFARATVNYLLNSYF